LQVDTVGRVGQPGEQIQSVISVGMLSEGWDAKTVTHIMGLRAFTSQLLCEQVVGRGLRKTSYELNPETGLFDPEYVNIFGVPFTFLPHESTEGAIPAPPKPKTAVEPDPKKARFEIGWPNVIRIDHV
jgi:type III restriction enzyme